MKNLSFEAFLLKKINLANDDIILEVFSENLGRMSIFAHKLGRSKKRSAEIDFFRLLEFEVQKNRTGTFRLKKVHTKRVYSIFSKNYKNLKQGFFILERLENILGQEKPYQTFFSIFKESLSQMDEEIFLLITLFLRVKLLQISGLMPRFDSIRSDLYLDPITLSFYKQYAKNLENFIYIKNISRQFLEFLRRAHLQELLEKKDIFLQLDLEEIDKILKNIEQYHTK